MKRIKYMKMIVNLLKIYFRLPVCLIKIIARFIPRYDYNAGVGILLKSECDILEKESEQFFSYRERPKYPSKQKMINCVDSNCSDIAVILQGPLMKEHDFTLETIRLYKQLYSKMKIIVSTWCGEDIEYIEKIKKEGAIVVVSETPERSGYLNINYQIVSTNAGIEKAKELNVKYICKSRTDQRLYKNNVFEFMKSLIDSFSSNNSVQNGRIVCLGTQFGSMIRPYYLSDFMYFGTVDEIVKMFSVSLDVRDRGRIITDCSVKKHVEEDLCPECILMRNYAAMIGVNNEVSIKAYWDLVKNNLICLGFDDVGLYWPKYDDRYCENERMGYYFSKKTRLNEWRKHNFGFLEWFNLYMGNTQYDESLEEYLEEWLC